MFASHKTLLMALVVALAPLSVNGQDRAQRERELQQVREEIAALEKKLSTQSGARVELLAELRDIELAVATVSRDIRKLDRDIDQQQREMDELDARRTALDARLVSHQGRLAAQLRAAYRVGQLQTLQLLLNQRNPADVSRVLTYARYLNTARVGAINDTRATLTELRQLIKAIEGVSRALANSRRLLDQEQQALTRNRQNRTKVLATLDQELARGGARLQGLNDDRQRLEELLRSLSELLTDIPAPLEQRPFPKLKGKLPWPAKGRVAVRFNTPRGLGALKWRGILIAAPTGNNVRAIHYGQVVFARWLPGFGLLLIVDHNDGFMSLYGYNEALHKEAGDWVVPGEIIATVGDSGGQSKSGLYFEIRESGTPVNPQRWITRKFSAASPG